METQRIEGIVRKFKKMKSLGNDMGILAMARFVGDVMITQMRSWDSTRKGEADEIEEVTLEDQAYNQIIRGIILFGIIHGP